MIRERIKISTDREGREYRMSEEEKRKKKRKQREKQKEEREK